MLAIIGGTGIYSIEGLEITDRVEVDTPFGEPSAPIIQANYAGKEVVFLPRHGEHHQFLPHEINYRANIFALKSLGVKQILGFSAVGSLREDIHPGEFAVASQYFDFIKGNREKTFFGEGMAAHISTALPTCENITKWVQEGAARQNITLHTQKTYACVDGPRLGTKAESHFLRTIGCDLVGMTNVPEVFLAREAQINYATIGIATDYDCWMEDESHHVSVAEVFARYGESITKAKALLLDLLQSRPAINEEYRQTLKNALVTPLEAIPINKKELINTLLT